MVSVQMPIPLALDKSTMDCNELLDGENMESSKFGQNLNKPPLDCSNTCRSSHQLSSDLVEGDQVMVKSIQNLLTLYKVYVQSKSSKACQVSSGGLQQFLNRKFKKRSSQLDHQQRCDDDQTGFSDLPDYVKLHIFSFLDAKTLCRVSNVNTDWYELTNDNLLWKRKLQRDMNQWNVVGHATNPDVYEECHSEWSYKEIYLRCSPTVNHLVRQSNINFHHLSSMLRSLWPKKTPKLAMFGPGLEYSTSSIVRKILEDPSGGFETTRMFPGQFEGFGSGFTLKMKDSTSFHLITLYPNTRAERQKMQPGERLQRSRLVDQRSLNNDPEDQSLSIELCKPVKDLCHTLDGLIFVVDATQDPDIVAQGHLELHAMVNETWTSSRVPLLVLSCIPSPSSLRLHSSLQIARLLKLGNLNRPWQVYDCMIENAADIQTGIQWLTEQAQR